MSVQATYALLAHTQFIEITGRKLSLRICETDSVSDIISINIMIRVSKALQKMLIRQSTQKEIFSHRLHGGDETSKSWKPLLNTIFGFRRLVGTVRVSVLKISFVHFDEIAL